MDVHDLAKSHARDDTTTFDAGEYSVTMHMPKVAIIGGTGIGEKLLGDKGCAIQVPTRFGIMRARIVGDVLVLARHGAGHKLPPHKINYRAMALGLKFLGVEYCIASAAVGSLREDCSPGTLVGCSDFIELSGRNITLFDDTVRHTDFTTPFDACVREAIATSEGVMDGGIYVNANGPRYETPREIRFFRQIGGDVVGMTAGSEAIVMREAGIKYSCLAIVSNLASGLAGTTLSHEEVQNVMEQTGDKAVSVLLQAAERLRGA